MKISNPVHTEVLDLMVKLWVNGLTKLFLSKAKKEWEASGKAMSSVTKRIILSRTTEFIYTGQ